MERADFAAEVCWACRYMIQSCALAIFLNLCVSGSKPWQTNKRAMLAISRDKIHELLVLFTISRGRQISVLVCYFERENS